MNEHSEGRLDDLFREFWWLSFPLAGLIVAAIELAGEARGRGVKQ